ncbi:sodium-dependent nutrient amino acid transporter 1-like [Diabrotica undecimpunctata]|uniref:sodium-dependent nutrient amino acid transporter 1-like n=1 Tax=Diabrotica undecimpunctata TaxID=50387 RepID=UPI003B64156E
MDENKKEHAFDNPVFVSSPDDAGHKSNGKIQVVEENDNSPQRSQWGNDIEFLMSCVAMSVGLGNVWRFPFIASSNGGGAFLIPYLIVLTLVGRPMYYMEMVLGQFCSRGPGKMYSKMSPVLKGIGIGQVFGATCIASYYCILMAITLLYLVNSFTNNFPWATCWESWEEYLNGRNFTCVDKNSVNFSSNNTISSAEMFFRREVLKEKDNISDGLGAPDWKLTLFLLVSWFATFLVSIKGVRSSGKASYFLAIFPYIVMIVLLIRASTLPGAAEGMKYFVYADFSRLKDAEVWYAAVTQCFFSLNVGFGNIVTLASYNKFSHNINRDAFIITTLDTFTSLLSGVTIFGILGNLAYEMKIPPSEVIAAGGGTALAFISYPDALSKFTFAPWLFAITFFVMLFVLGLGSLQGLHGNLNGLIKEYLPYTPDWKIAGCSSIILFLVGLIYVTQGGQYALDLVDFFGGTFVIFVCAICEVFVIAYIYGVDRLCLDIEFMSKRKVGIYWRLTWGLLMPLLLILIFLYFIWTLKPITYGIDSLRLPLGLEIFGWSILAVTVIQLMGWFFYYLYANRKYPGIQKLTETFSFKTWGPEGRQRTEEWKKFLEEKNATQQGKRSVIPTKIKAIFIDPYKS